MIIVRCLQQTPTSGAVPQQFPNIPQKSITDLLDNDLIHQLMLASSGHVEQVQSLVHLGAPVDVKDKCGRTVLWSMAARWHTFTQEQSEQGVTTCKTAKFLIENGADIEFACPKELDTALLSAISYHQTELVELLVRKGADLSDRYCGGWTNYTIVQECILDTYGLKMLDSLFTVPREGEEGDEAKLISRRNELLAAKNEEGQGVLGYLSSYSGPACVEYLLDLGAEVDISEYVPEQGDGAELSAFWNLFRKSPFDRGVAALLLYRLVRGTDKEARKQMLNKEKNAEGWTVLHEAANAGCQEGIEFLLERGADLDVLTGTVEISGSPQEERKEQDQSVVRSQKIQGEATDGGQNRPSTTPKTALIIAIRADHRHAAMMMFQKGATLKLALELDSGLQEYCDTQRTNCKRWLSHVIRELHGQPHPKKRKDAI